MLLWCVICIVVAAGVTMNLHYSLRPQIHARRFRRECDARLPEDVRARIEGRIPDDWSEDFCRIAGAAAGHGITDGNKVEIITSGKRKFELLLADLEAARESINMEYFLFGYDSGSRKVIDVLLRKAGEGVKVRFVLENFANMGTQLRYIRRMRKAGVEVRRFTPIPLFYTRGNYRNHRKILVIDGKVGFTGGMNIHDRYFHSWRDTHIRVEGGAVAQLQYIFLSTWLYLGGKVEEDWRRLFPVPDACGWRLQVAAGEPGLKPHPLHAALVWILLNAKKYVYIQTPYLAPPGEVLDALKKAASSGVEVILMLSAKKQKIVGFMEPVKRSFFRECLLAGVRIVERGGEYMHCKTLVSDDRISCIGSANLDNRSLRFDYEDNVFFFGGEPALENRKIFLADLEISREITLEQVDAWPWYVRALNSLLRIISPVF